MTTMRRTNRSHAESVITDGCQMGFLYRTLPYKHLNEWLSLDSYIKETDPYFNHTVLLQRDDEGSDYDVPCKQLQDEAVEEWKRIAASSTGSDLWRAQMKDRFQAMEAGANEFLHWKLSSKRNHSPQSNITLRWELV